MSFKWVCGIAVAVLASISGTASAESITFRFEGTVTYAVDMAVPGDKIVGTFSYATERAAMKMTNSYANYRMPVPHALTAVVGNHTISAGNLDIAVWNDYGGNVEDMVDVYGGYPAVVDGTTFPNGSFGFRLASSAGNTKVLPNIRLPSSYSVAEFDSASVSGGMLQIGGGQGEQLLFFTVDSITVLQTTR